MSHVVEFRRWIGCAMAVGLLVSGCSGGSSGGSHPAASGAHTGGSWTAGSPSAGAPSMPAPVYDREASFFGTPTQPDRLRVKLYPLQRVAGGLLLTVDFTPVSNGGAVGLNYFDSSGSGALGNEAFRGTSLIDTRSLIRYGPLRAGSATGAAYSSTITETIQKLGVTYRLGGFFPDPGPSVNRLSVDLQLGGMVPDVPISSDTRTAPGLVLNLPGAAQAVVRDDLVTWAVKAPEPGAFVDRHELVANVVGGTVNEGSQGLVSVNADVLFAFDSATVTAAGAGLVRQAATILAAKADPAKPVAVVGYTDAKGTPAYNLQLSTQRAAAVSSALTATGLLGGFSLRAEGRGEKEPVAANTKPGGGDDPQGRALNRRVQISYTPKAEPQPTTSASSTVAAATSSTTTASAGDAEPAVRLPKAALPVGSGGAQVYYDPAVYPVTRDGRMTLVRFDLTLEKGNEDFLAALSSHTYSSRDLGDVRLVDPATQRAYVPAYDRDTPDRVLCTYSTRMNSGSPYHFACYMAALPPGTVQASVSLSDLGTATGVPVKG